MFCGLRFKFVFYQILWDVWNNFGLHLAQFLRKNLSENRFKKRGWRRRLACALLEQKQWKGLEFKFDFSSSSNCGSNSCPSLSWLQFEIEKLLENGCLSWLRLQKFRKQFEKNGRADIKTQCSWSDTPTGPRPGEFFAQAWQAYFDANCGNPCPVADVRSGSRGKFRRYLQKSQACGWSQVELGRHISMRSTLSL